MKTCTNTLQTLLAPVRETPALNMVTSVRWNVLGINVKDDVMLLAFPSKLSLMALSWLAGIPLQFNLLLHCNTYEFCIKYEQKITSSPPHACKSFSVARICQREESKNEILFTVHLQYSDTIK